MNELTEIQRRVFEFVRDKLVSGDSAPTPREIAAKFGWRSKRASICTTRWTCGLSEQCDPNNKGAAG